MDFVGIDAIEFSLLLTALILSVLTVVFFGKLRLAKFTSLVGKKEERRENMVFDYYMSHILYFIVIAFAVGSGIWKGITSSMVLVFGLAATNFIIASIQVKKMDNSNEEFKQSLTIPLTELLTSVIVIAYSLTGINIF